MSDPQTDTERSEPIRSKLDAIAFIESLIRVEPRNQSTRNELGLACIQALLSQLDDPHRRLHCVHLAGSKGKGSTALITEHLLRAAGYSTGLYTSPHLLDWNERYRLNGQPVADTEFAAMLEITRYRRGFNQEPFH